MKILQIILSPKDLKLTEDFSEPAGLWVMSHHQGHFRSTALQGFYRSEMWRFADILSVHSQNSITNPELSTLVGRRLGSNLRNEHPGRVDTKRVAGVVNALMFTSLFFLFKLFTTSGKLTFYFAQHMFPTKIWNIRNKLLECYFHLFQSDLQSRNFHIIVASSFNSRNILEHF